MAFVTGTATSYANLLTAIQSALSANGWTLTSGILSKGSCFIDMKVANPFATGTLSAIIAKVGNSAAAGALTGTLPTQGVRIGPFNTISSAYDLTFPCTYKVFINTSPDEVYIVVNFNSTMYQWIAFGQSPAAGSTGNGVWLAGTMGQITSGTMGITLATSGPFGITKAGVGGSSGAYVAPGLFMNSAFLTNGPTFSTANAVMHTGSANNGGWSQASASNPVSELPNAYMAEAPLLGVSPNNWNSQSVLFKILVSIPAGSNKIQLVGDLKHSRYVKINNLNPEAIITLGSDRWMTFPLFVKGASELDGLNSTNTGYYGHAFRYDGP